MRIHPLEQKGIHVWTLKFALQTCEPELPLFYEVFLLHPLDVTGRGDFFELHAETGRDCLNDRFALFAGIMLNDPAHLVHTSRSDLLLEVPRLRLRLHPKVLAYCQKALLLIKKSLFGHVSTHYKYGRTLL